MKSECFKGTEQGSTYTNMQVEQQYELSMQETKAYI